MNNLTNNIISRKCCQCECSFLLCKEFFYLKIDRKDGKCYTYFTKKCKICIKNNKCNKNNNIDIKTKDNLSDELRLKNKETIAKQSKEWKENNKEKIKKYRQKWRSKNKDKIKEYSKKWKGNNKEKIKKYRSSDLLKLRNNVSRTINFMIKHNGGIKGNSIIKYLPYSITELKEHIEKQFESWMSWNNYGKYKVFEWNDEDKTTWKWQIDHIVPQSKLPYDSMEHENFKKCWALENLRPYSAKQNMLDGAREP